MNPVSHPAETVALSPVALTRDVAEHSLASDLSELTKARLTTMVLLTTLTGFGLASRGAFDWTKLFHTLLGAGLVAVCSSILNQALERKTDAKMRRTQARPFVTGRLPLRETILAGMVLGALGLAELIYFVNSLTALLAALTLVVYVLVYTPLKRRTELNTLVGTIPGALPPLLGATAVTGHFNAAGWTLFALLTFWQLPHFYAIAWLFRDDYRAGGLKMVSTDDATGARTAWHALISALLLLPVSLLPWWIGTAGIFYGIVAGLLTLGFIATAVQFARQPDHPHARVLFLASIAYLPLVLAALALDIPIRNWLGC